MVRKTQMYFKMWKMLTDVTAVSIVGLFLYKEDFSLEHLLISGGVVFLGMALMKGYTLGDPLPFWETVRRAFYVVAVAVFSWLSFDPIELSFLDLVQWVVLAAVYLIGFRILIEWYESRYYKGGRGQVPILIVGMSRSGEAFIKKHQEDASLARLRFVGFLDNTQKQSVEGVPFLGKLAELENRIKSYRPEAILQVGDSEQAVTITTICQRYNIDYFVLPALLGAFGGKVISVEQGGFPLISVKETRLTGWGYVAKRSFDVLAAISIAAMILPVWLFLHLMIVWHHKSWQVFVKETRVDGRTGKVFPLWRYKTLEDGEVEPVLTQADLAIGNPRKMEGSGSSQTSRFSGLLRRLELNELPQLWNVLNGSMSIVGPRPPYKEEIEHYTNLHYKRLRMKPGLTGLWQVEKDRTNKTIEDLLRMDIYYIENWSLLLDLQILWKTGCYLIKQLKRS